MGTAVLAVAALLALSGCSGDDGGAGAKQPTATVSVSTTPGVTSTPSSTGTPVAGGSSSGTPTVSASAPASTTGPSGDPNQGVEGVWLATQGGTKVQLVLGKGKAGLTSTHLCAGVYTDQGGISLTLTCMDGDKERTAGHGVLADDGATLTVTWNDGPTDTFARTGLPSN